MESILKSLINVSDLTIISAEQADTARKELAALEEKAAVLDWLLTPVPSTRPDRPARLERQINIDHLKALMVFRAFGTPEEILTAIRKEMK